MSNPLDELRNTTKSLQQKQEENLKKTKEMRMEQQKLLSKDSTERHEQIKKDAKAMAEKSRKIKIAILSIAIALLCGFLAFSIRMAATGTYKASSKSELLSDKISGIDADNKEYVPLKTFIKSITTDFQKKPEIDTIPWYSSLPMECRERYFDKMVKLKFNGTWKLVSIQENKEREKFSIDLKNDTGNEITFDIIYNPDMMLKIVKIY